MSEIELPATDRQFHDVLGRRPKVLWVASSGGHVAQAHRIERLIGANSDSVWVTFDVPQTRTLLQARRVEHVEYVAPRDFVAAARAATKILQIAKSESFDFVVSTGAAIGLFGLPLAAFRGRAPVLYIESLARSQGPSLTGKAMRLVPRVSTFTQYISWETQAWQYTGTILDSFKSESAGGAANPRKIFVTLGTIRPYRFDRLIDAILSLLEPADEVTWQLGVTNRVGLPGEVHAELPGTEMNRHMREADVIITHSGVGSILACLELGKSPVVAVRDARYAEHVDGHQQFIADVVAERHLAQQLDLRAPRREVLVAAAALTIKSESDTEGGGAHAR